jgi:hypothetical protein
MQIPLASELKSDAGTRRSPPLSGSIKTGDFQEIFPPFQEGLGGSEPGLGIQSLTFVCKQPFKLSFMYFKCSIA